VVVGTSPVLGIHAWPDERDFANLGVRDTGAEMLAPFFRRLHETRPGPLTVFLGIAPFWLNDGVEPPNRIGDQPLKTLDYLLSQLSLRLSLRLLRGEPEALTREWAQYELGGRCVLDRGSQVVDGEAEAWEPDGSLSSRWHLRPDLELFSRDGYYEDLVTFETGSYVDWDELDEERVGQVEEALGLARRYGWTVVGLGTPYAARYTSRLASAAESREGWRAYGRHVPALFERYGFAFVDLRRVRDVPCADDAFDYGNDGWHPDRACSMRVRRHLDRAAARLRGQI
jgi:hypothetical protein